MATAGLYKLYQKLFKAYGPQNWWPAKTPFEVMVGAVLTQNTSWSNVEKAIANLKQHRVLHCKKILALEHEQLASLIRSAGYFNVKAKRLVNFCNWYIEQKNLHRLSDLSLREALLSVNGVGPETADDILLYAFDRPVFVIDAYTKRLCTRLGRQPLEDDYESWRQWFEYDLRRVSDKVKVFNEYHALIVHHAKYFCTARSPQCEQCCLKRGCDFYNA